MVTTIPGICYTVTRLSQGLAKSKFFPFNEGKARLTLCKSHNQSAIFKKSQKVLKLGFYDVDWANLSDTKSVSGLCFKLAEITPMISWKSKKQNSVALSTCKSRSPVC